MIASNRLRKLRDWHQDRADSWATTIQREPETMPLSPEVRAEFKATEQIYRDTVSMIDAVLAQPAVSADDEGDMLTVAYMHGFAKGKEAGKAEQPAVSAEAQDAARYQALRGVFTRGPYLFSSDTGQEPARFDKWADELAAMGTPPAADKEQRNG